MPAELAPCVAVVGPANSGKTTFLHLLDRALQSLPEEDAPLAYVVKGNPDGTGRYLYEAPALREELEPRVKGRWAPGTVAAICRWIDGCRASLELVLVDFGGRHSAEDEEILARCSHFLVVARDRSGEPADEYGDTRSWKAACMESGLEPVARVCSLWETGEARVRRGRDGVLEADLRADAREPGDETNAAVVEAMVEKLLRLRVRRPAPGYLDLHRPERWTVDDLETVGGLAPRLAERVRAGAPVVLGGVAPVWAYAAVLHRALDHDPGAAVLVFDPKLGKSLVTIPAGRNSTPPDPASPLARGLSVRWSPDLLAEGTALDVTVRGPDRFLPPECIQDLPRAPLPPGPIPDSPLILYGSLPIWLALTYSRFLRQLAPGRPIGHWDASTGEVVVVHDGE